MEFSVDDRLMALAVAQRVLVIALYESGSLDIDAFADAADRGIARYEAIGATGVANATAELLQPLISDLRRVHASRTAGRS